VSVVRILIWNLADSKTTLEEVRGQLPSLPEGDIWIANEPAERFGLVSLGDATPDLEPLRRLIGKDPEVAEEFDTVSLRGI
jgi:hypothetical protein